MEQKGYLAEGDDRLPAGEAALWAIQGIEPRQAAPPGRDPGDGDRPGRRRGRAVPGPPAPGARPGGRARSSGRGADRRLPAPRLTGIQPSGAGGWPALAARQAGRLPALGGPRVPARQDGLLGVPRAAAGAEPRRGGLLASEKGLRGALSRRPRRHARHVAARLEPGGDRDRALDRQGRGLRPGRQDPDPGRAGLADADPRPRAPAPVPGVWSPRRQP